MRAPPPWARRVLKPWPWPWPWARLSATRPAPSFASSCRPHLADAIFVLVVRVPQVVLAPAAAARGFLPSMTTSSTRSRPRRGSGSNSALTPLDATGEGPADHLVESARHLEVLLGLRERGLDHIGVDLLAVKRRGDPIVRGGHLRGGDHVRGWDTMGDGRVSRGGGKTRLNEGRFSSWVSRVMPLPSFMMRREAMTTSTSVLGSPGWRRAWPSPLELGHDGLRGSDQTLSPRTSSDEANKLSRDAIGIRFQNRQPDGKLTTARPVPHPLKAAPSPTRSSRPSSVAAPTWASSAGPASP